jgi:hypothetical protein
MSKSTMRPILIVVSTPILHLFTRIGKGQEPVPLAEIRRKAGIS